MFKRMSVRDGNVGYFNVLHVNSSNTTSATLMTRFIDVSESCGCCLV